MQKRTSQPYLYYNFNKDESENDFFRPRTHSDISAYDSNQLSATFNPNSHDFNQWVPNNTPIQVNPSYMNDIMNCTDQICLNPNNKESASVYSDVSQENLKSQSQPSTYRFGYNQVVNQPNRRMSNDPMSSNMISQEQVSPKCLKNVNTFVYSESDLNDIGEIVRRELSKYNNS
jgi:hypothetical protein